MISLHGIHVPDDETRGNDMNNVMNFQLSMPDRPAGTAARELRRSVLTRTVDLLQHIFAHSTDEDFRAIDSLLARAAENRTTAIPDGDDADRRSLVARLTGGREYSALERVALEADNMERLFEARRLLLADALTAPGAAELLGTTRQTPYDRARRGTLLAVMDRGMLRFPRWQFDSQGPGGVVAGLPEVMRALSISPLAKASWLTRANSTLEERTPLETLQAGEMDRVRDAAAAVGVG
jgi:hypothetical protein